ncbi:EAL domain-containing protein [Sphingomonas rhizophila]|uniref:EAL domain-containing protein n=1 Tax=Sphingomonas rhizophila TaxID=2071607 RepID=A0A7G9SCU9_9SPHN|nr:EAL domain-containing protein [Sphingomonas rhizophila]QNN65674.1 EAL domain-containing protein [Sphingomonas rhizophila]
MIAQADLGMLDGLERALLNGRLHMAYQPKVSLRDGSLRRVEALVRWDDPELGAVPPSRFVPLAERHGLIDDLTQWGLRTTLRQWRKWQDEGIDTDLAFNISAVSLDQLDFPDLVERMCRALAVPTERLVLELTEGATQPLIKLMDTLTRFRIKGIGLAIDDFGVGYSTLMQLRQLPFTELKIDRFFVQDSPQEQDSALIVRSIIDLAHGLGLSVTAEGVETPAQLRLLRALECDIAQGYLVSQPLAPDTLGAWYESWKKQWPELVGERRRPRADPTSRRSRNGHPEPEAEPTHS